MSSLPYVDSIKCCFSELSGNSTEYIPNFIEVYFVETKILDSWFSCLKNYISEDEQIIANNFYSDIYRKTYLSCHALLRLMLAEKLNMNPLDLSIIRGINNKPVLSCNHAYFNLSHTRDAFAFVIARDFHVGIDLEKVRQILNIHPIMDNFFNFTEREYILDEEVDTFNRFFLLWTRKEAFLKALGTGLIENLNQIIVSEPINLLRKELFDNLGEDFFLNEYYLYSYNISNHVITIATAGKSSISFYNLNEENIYQLALETFQS